MCPVSLAARLEVSVIVNLILILDLPVSFTPDSLLSWWWPWQPLTSLPPSLSLSLSPVHVLPLSIVSSLWRETRLSRRYLMADRPQLPVGLIINVLSQLSISSRRRGDRGRHTYTYRCTHTQICAHACGYLLKDSQSQAKEPIWWHILVYPLSLRYTAHIRAHIPGVNQLWLSGRAFSKG